MGEYLYTYLKIEPLRFAWARKNYILRDSIKLNRWAGVFLDWAKRLSDGLPQDVQWSIAEKITVGNLDSLLKTENSARGF